MQVDFVIAGAQKSGTTTLHALLSQHPAIHMAPGKGTHFFDTDEHFSSTVVDYSAYHACFSPEATQRLVGESTPIYSFWETAARRLWEYNRGMKVIVILRNPIDRAYSHWNMQRSKRREPHSFEEALTLEEARARACAPMQDRHASYAARGFYTEQLRRLWRFFPPGQVLVLRMEDVVSPHPDAVDQVWDFLGLDRPPLLAPVRANQRAYAAPMASATRRQLAQTFEGEIRSLERMLGWDLSSWLAQGPTLSEGSAPR